MAANPDKIWLHGGYDERDVCRTTSSSWYDSGDTNDQEGLPINNYHGFARHDFQFGQHMATIVVPHRPLAEKRWIWRTEFLGAFDTADVAMLHAGYYLVHYAIPDLYGCPQAVRLMKDFYDLLVAERQFEQKTTLFGFSRGGLYAVNFAVEYPDAICALYLDAPVLDIKSWPGGLGEGQGAPKEFAECLEHYGLDEQTVLHFSGNPIDRVHELIEASIPVIVVAGDSDQVVPHTENCQRLIEAYAEHNGNFKYILKPGCGHHPHSLEDPAEIVDFLLGCR